MLGTEDSAAYVTSAGGRVVPLNEAVDATVVIIADQKGFSLLQGMNQVLSLIMRRMDKGQTVHLLLCNPDIIYPVSSEHYGFTAGGLAAMLEAALNERYPNSGTYFVRLGKPHSPIFDEAIKRLGKRNLVMLGDQLTTDISGANRVGIDSVLVGTGVAESGDHTRYGIEPTWFLESLL